MHSIAGIIGKPKRDHRFVDLFCGTGIVSRSVGVNGWPILANDSLHAATILTSAGLISRHQVPFEKTGGYSATIEALNNLDGIEGFFYKEYSTSCQNKEGVERPYFTLDNACKIDAIRAQITAWSASGMITLIEKQLLLGDLIASVNQIANIAGTYGCFLKRFSESSMKTLKVSERNLLIEEIKNEVLNMNAFDVSVRPNDTVYIDPPYTKRQYAAYYHIPETIACEDEPEVDGVTGLRPWKEKSSPFCFKVKAPTALKDLFEGLPAKRILLSYSTDGHIPFKQVAQIASLFGNVNITEFEDFERYAPNTTARKNATEKKLMEYIVDITR